jgi:hypothetical protein
MTQETRNHATPCRPPMAEARCFGDMFGCDAQTTMAGPPDRSNANEGLCLAVGTPAAEQKASSTGPITSESSPQTIDLDRSVESWVRMASASNGFTDIG